MILFEIRTVLEHIQATHIFRGPLMQAIEKLRSGLEISMTIYGIQLVI